VLVIGGLLYGGFVYRAPPAPRQLVSGALILCQLGAYDKAQSDLKLAMDAYPDYVDAKLVMAHTEQALNKPLAAAQLYTECLDQLENEEQRSDVLFRIGLNYLKAGRFWSARQYATRLSTEFGPSAHSYLIAGLSSYGMGDDKGFRDAVTQVYAHDPTSPVLRWKVRALLPNDVRASVYGGAVISMVDRGL
jgi:Tfp pilus assembly protein PilF